MIAFVGCRAPETVYRMKALGAAVENLVARHPGAAVAVSVRDRRAAFDRNAFPCRQHDESAGDD